MTVSLGRTGGTPGACLANGSGARMTGAKSGGSFGGAVAMTAAGVVSNCLFTGNTSSGHGKMGRGGAIYANAGRIVDCEMSGNGNALNQMLRLMRNGGKVALLGIAAPGTVIDWNDVIFKGLTLQGVYGRKMYETWYKMMAMVEAGLDLSPILTHRYHYTEFEEAFAVMNSGLSGKVVLDWTEEKA